MAKVATCALSKGIPSRSPLNTTEAMIKPGDVDSLYLHTGQPSPRIAAPEGGMQRDLEGCKV